MIIIYPSYVNKTSKDLVVGSKYKFVIQGNMALGVVAEYANSDHTSDYETFFKKVGETRKSDGSMFCTYCSCGSNAMWTSGDNCQPVEHSDGWHCEGGCLGENQGKTCSFTQVSYPRVGGGPPRSGEVSF
jgi:hypothetical protein